MRPGLGREGVAVSRAAWWRGAFWACALAVLVLALMPPTPRMPSTGWDKSNHLLAFGTLALLGRRAWPRRAVAWLAGLLLAYGGLIEILQSFTPDRSAEWADLLADALGIGCGLALAGLLAWRPGGRRAGPAAPLRPSTPSPPPVQAAPDRRGP